MARECGEKEGCRRAQCGLRGAVDLALHAITGMPTREFIDGQGRTWRVWSTVPSIPRALSPEFEQGWLTFETDGEVRRYAPIPIDWTEISDTRLELLCRSAVLRTPRRTPPRGLIGGSGGSGDADAR